MADLQKQIGVRPSVSSLGNPPAPTDSGAGKALSQIGETVKTFVLDKKKENFLEDIEKLGDPSTVRAISDNFLAGKKEFDRLKIGLAQGALTQTHVNIAAEALLKEAIGSTPGLAPELRRYAASQLGFDPTGTHLRALMDSALPPKEEKNPILEEMRNTAEALNLTAGIPIESSMRLQGKNLEARLHADRVTQNATIGAAGRIDIFNATLAEHDNFLSDTMAQVVLNVEQGGIRDPEFATGLVRQNMMAQKELLRSRYVEAGMAADSTSLAKDFAQIDAQWEPVMSMIKDGSFQEVVTRNAKELTQLMSIQGMNLMGDVYLMNQMGGQEAVGHFFTTLSKHASPDQFALLKRNNPVLARYAENVDQMTLAAADAYKRVMGVDPAFSTDPRFTTGSPATKGNPEREAAISALSDQMFYDMVSRKGTPEEREALVNFAASHGKKFKMVGAYAQPRARLYANDQEVDWMKARYDEVPELKVRAAAELNRVSKILGRDIPVLIKNGKLVLSGDTDSDFGAGFTGGQTQASALVGSTLSGDIARLNAFVDATRNGWAEDFGTTADKFLNETYSDISVQSKEQPKDMEALNRALDDYDANPTRENLERVRALDPDLVSSVESDGGGLSSAK